MRNGINDATPEEWDKSRKQASDWMAATGLGTQVGGEHYLEMGLQPFQMTYANFGYMGLKASVYTKVNKYLLRDKGTDLEDIEKAIHCLEVLKEKYRQENGV